MAEERKASGATQDGTGWKALAVPGLATLSVYLLLGWTREFSVALLVMAVLLAGAAAVLAVRLHSGSPGVAVTRLAMVPLFGSLLAGGLATQRFARIEYDWPDAGVAREEALRVALTDRMTEVVERGRRAAQLAATLAPQAATPARLEAIREAARVAAVFRLNAAGGLETWAGDHRGLVPEEVRGNATTFFAERPLFSYLYFAAPARDAQGTAVAAVLVDAELSGLREGVASAGTSVGRELDVVFRPGGAPGEDDWRLIADGDTIVHAQLPPITQASLREEVEGVARRIAVVVGLAALLLLWAGWLRSGEAAPVAGGRTILPLIVLAFAFAIAPLGDALGLNELFAPSLFVLPVPGDLSLGGIIAPVIALAALVATLRPPLLDSRRYVFALVAGSVAVAVGYPATLRLLLEAASPTLLEGGAALWFGLQPTAVLLLAGLTALALPRAARTTARGARVARRRSLLAASGALAVGALLALLVLWRRDPRDALMPWTAVLWVAPFLLLSSGFARYSRRTGVLVRWLGAGALAATAVLPHLWLAHTHARLEAASREVESLGPQLPPIVEFLLVEFGSEVRQHYAEGERGLQLLYRSWVGSGLAGEPYGARITLWSPEGEVVSEVALGGASDGAAGMERVRALAAAARNDSVARPYGITGVPTISKVLTTPLGDGHVVTVSVPPRRTVGRPSVLAPFLSTSPDPALELNMVEASGGEVPGDGEIHWERAPGGFRSDVVVSFPDGVFHAHTRVGTPGPGVTFARGVLLIAFDLFLLVLLWFGGSYARGLSPYPPGAPAALVASFRARVTLALFAFFLVPTALFGWVAYRALASEVERAATTISARAVRQAVQEFPESGGDLRTLADRIGAEVLYFYNSGELAQASSPEALGLGVYSAWMAPETQRTLASGEEPAVEEVRRLGEEQYLVAYRTLRPAGILAVPTSLSSGATAARQRELAHLILFAALMGALLSFALSVFVGRALAGPIGRLQRAAAAVGAGRLRVRLPEPQGDEFGQLYSSFNRMVRRLRRARIRERETARVLAWGEMAQQVAHEIKNPLTPIKLSVQHLRRAHRDRSPEFERVLEENTEQILLEIDRLTEISRSFSRYGTPDRHTPLEAVDVPAVVREALTLYRSSADAIRYEDEVPADMPRVRARRNEVKEVLLNLVENAREAFEGPGRVTIRAAAVDGRVDLEVEDNGPGIPAELLPRIFEPHFSTRSTGTGLGLAIVRRLVESWGGTVTATSEPGRGTTVRLRLDVADSQRAR